MWHRLLDLRLLALLVGRIRRVQDVWRKMLRRKGVSGYGNRYALAVHHVNLRNFNDN